MNQPLRAYFRQEKNENMAYLSLGSFSMLIAMLVWIFVSDSFIEGMAIPLAVMGCIKLLVGWVSYTRDKQRFVDMLDTIQQNPADFVKQERQRMLRVIHNYDLYRWTGIILCLTGIGMSALSLLAKDTSFWAGLGIGLFVQSAILLLLDLIAEKRAGRYVAWIEEMKNGLT